MRVSRPLLPAHRQAEARAIGRRTQQTFLLAALTGVLVGLAVVAIQKITVDGLLDSLADRPLAVQVVAPGVGLVVAALCLRWIAGSPSRSTADEYVRSFHDQGTERLHPRPPLGRGLAALRNMG